MDQRKSDASALVRVICFKIGGLLSTTYRLSTFVETFTSHSIRVGSIPKMVPPVFYLIAVLLPLMRVNKLLTPSTTFP